MTHRLSIVPASRRRGSTFLLVLSVLAITILIATTLAYVAQVDARTSRNFVDSVGARLALASGLQQSPPFLQRFQLVTAETQLWSQSLAALPETDPNLQYLRRRLEKEAGRRLSGPEVALPPIFHDTTFVDLSGKLNINAAGSLLALSGAGEGEGSGLAPHELMLSRSIGFMLAEAGLDPGQAPQIAREIVEYRLGPDLAPGVAGIDDNANGATARPGSDQIDNDDDGEIDEEDERDLAIDRLDERLEWVAATMRVCGQTIPASSGKRPATPFFALENDGLDDLGVGQADSRFDEGVDEPAEYNPDLRAKRRGDDRVFPTVAYLSALPSVSPEAYLAIAPHVTAISLARNATLDNDESHDRVNLNHAELEAIVQHLRRALGDHVDDRMIAQFACNLADRRDPDDVRSEYKALDGTTILGFERVPLITEVYPDSRTLAEDGDDGQFVEIHNPWDHEIDLADWSLDLGGRRFSLKNKVLPPGAWLIVTDDYKDDNDEAKDQNSSKKSGSFFGVFDRVSSGSARQILEVPQFNLPDRSGTVRLYDSRNNLADEFTYRNEGSEGTTLSHQRLHPFLAAQAYAAATPMAAIAGQAQAKGRDFIQSMKADEGFNHLFRSNADLMLVSSAWAESDFLDGDPRLWQFPTLGVDDEELARRREVAEAAAAEQVEGDENSSATDAKRNLDSSLIDLFYVGAARDYSASHRHALINVNTASRPVLLALPGMTEEMADAILKRRERLAAQVGTLEEPGLLPQAAFERPSDLLSVDEIWPANTPRSERVATFSKMANLISVSSSAFEATSVILERDQTGSETLRRRAARATVVLDGDDGGRLIGFELLR